MTMPCLGATWGHESFEVNVSLPQYLSLSRKSIGRRDALTNTRGSAQVSVERVEGHEQHAEVGLHLEDVPHDLRTQYNIINYIIPLYYYYNAT